MTAQLPHPENHRAGFVNIIGRPNVGKSTLLNALVGERLAIITAKAQTTRHRILGIVNGDDYQIVYSDTPGIIQPAYKMQEAMMQIFDDIFEDADVLLVVADATTNEDAALYAERLAKNTAPVLLLLNKTDQISPDQILQKLDFWQKTVKANAYIPISATKGYNIPAVTRAIIEHLPVSPPYYDKDELTDRPERFFIAEIIREKILLNYEQEIPYSVEVLVDAYKDLPDIVRISAVIIANRKSQKPILIGKGGAMLKRVGTQARRDIEQFLQKKVFLELYVKVREGWRDNDTQLKNFGY